MQHGVIDVGDIAFICPYVHSAYFIVPSIWKNHKEEEEENLLFPALGDGTLVLGSPGPSAKRKERIYG